MENEKEFFFVSQMMRMSCNIQCYMLRVSISYKCYTEGIFEMDKYKLLSCTWVITITQKTKNVSEEVEIYRTGDFTQTG